MILELHKDHKDRL